MDIKDVIRSQYGASLDMLEEAVTACPEPLWNDPRHQNRYWHLAYHALFYTDLYLSDTVETHTPWARHRDEHQFLGPLPWPPHAEPKIGEPYDRPAILEFLAVCRKRVETRVPEIDLEAPSGFPWLPLNKLELQIYSIRHLQHHTGQLADRLRAHGAKGLRWVGQGHGTSP